MPRQRKIKINLKPKVGYYRNWDEIYGWEYKKVDKKRVKLLLNIRYGKRWKFIWDQVRESYKVKLLDSTTMIGPDNFTENVRKWVNHNKKIGEIYKGVQKLIASNILNH